MSESPTTELARKIAGAVIGKLGLASKYTVAVRRRGMGEAAAPWIEIAMCKIGKPVETHESSIALMESHYVCSTKEERTALATYLYKQMALMAGKVEPKG